MGFLISILSIYLFIGFVYALYLLSVGASKTIMAFIINMLGGPIMIPYIYYLTKNNKDLPIGN